MRCLLKRTTATAVIAAACLLHGTGYAQSPGAPGWIVLTTTDPEGAPPPYYCVAFIVPTAKADVARMPWGSNFRVVVARYGPYDSMASANAALVNEGWAASAGRVAVSSTRC